MTSLRSQVKRSGVAGSIPQTRNNLQIKLDELLQDGCESLRGRNVSARVAVFIGRRNQRRSVTQEKFHDLRVVLLGSQVNGFLSEFIRGLQFSTQFQQQTTDVQLSGSSSQLQGPTLAWLGARPAGVRLLASAVASRPAAVRCLVAVGPSAAQVAYAKASWSLPG